MTDPETRQPTEPDLFEQETRLNATCTQKCTTECGAVIQRAWQRLRHPHRLTAAPYNPEVERQATQRAEEAAAASERGAQWFAAQGDTAEVEQLRAVITRIKQMTDTWEQRFPDVIRTPAVVSALRAVLDRVPQQPTRRRTHLAKGSNAKDCPACENTNPPYPFLCPGSGR